MKKFLSISLLMLAFVSFGFTPNIDVSLNNETKPKIEQFQELSKIDFTIYEIEKTEFIYNLISLIRRQPGIKKILNRGSPVIDILSPKYRYDE